MFDWIQNSKSKRVSILNSEYRLPESLMKISKLDTMYEEGNMEAYFSAGKLAFDICLRISNFDSTSRINLLDFPSGYGRVMRHLKHGFPWASLYACELDSRMLNFSSQEFGAQRIQANEECDITLPVKMDLIWTGSLLTHFDEWQWDNYLRTILNGLSDTGVAIFTTHGRRHASMAKVAHPIFGEIVDAKLLYANYRKTGFAFLPYSEAYPTFGLSLSSPKWVAAKLQSYRGLQICYFEEGAWGQDVWAVKKALWELDAEEN